MRVDSMHVGLCGDGASGSVTWFTRQPVAVTRARDTRAQHGDSFVTYTRVGIVAAASARRAGVRPFIRPRAATSQAEDRFVATNSNTMKSATGAQA